MKKTHFGYQEVLEHEKINYVSQVFTSVSDRYDLMNDLMSFGLHRYWKSFTINRAQVKKGQTILDIASGTGDLALAFSKKVGETGIVILTDINESMLEKGRDRLTDRGVINNVDYVQADVEALPFKENFFDCMTIAFGLRNVTNKEAALDSMYQAVKPGGKILVLEFSKPAFTWLNKLYDMYSFNVIPKLGKWIAKDEKSYQYLVESIRMHPDQDTLKAMMENAGFEDVVYHNLTGGIVALHIGYKY